MSDVTALFGFDNPLLVPLSPLVYLQPPGWGLPRVPPHSSAPPPGLAPGLEVHEDVVKILPGECLRPPVRQLGRLVEQHLPGPEADPVRLALVVSDHQGPAPGLDAGLGHVDDDADHVGVYSV